LAAAAILCLVWSLATPWAAAFFPLRQDHYKVSLFGVRHIADMTPNAKQTTCGWNDVAEGCYPAVGFEEKYALLARARWFVLAGLVFALIGVAAVGVGQLGPWAGLPFVFGGVATGAAITLVRSNVLTALASFAGGRVEINGSGLMAAQIATGLCFLAVLIAAIPTSTTSASSPRVPPSGSGGLPGGTRASREVRP
jgi:hypothetical protein